MIKTYGNLAIPKLTDKEVEKLIMLVYNVSDEESIEFCFPVKTAIPFNCEDVIIMVDFYIYNNVFETKELFTAYIRNNCDIEIFSNHNEYQKLKNLAEYIDTIRGMLSK